MSTVIDPASGRRADLNLQLADLRIEIDRIDSAMHQLLIDRSSIIDRLIEIKAAQGGGSAFRPGREAEMMRRIVERHTGHLPLDTVESIWRIIISTFTYVQSRYAVHVDLGDSEAAMRDSARFHFGFTVPLNGHADMGSVFRAVAAADGDLGLVRMDGGPSSRGAWWRGLEAADAPKAIARLPFVERPYHPAGVPVMVVARPLAAAASRDVVLWSLIVAQDREALHRIMSGAGGDVIATCPEAEGLAALVALPEAVAADQLRCLFASSSDIVALTEVGSHAVRFGIV